MNRLSIREMEQDTSQCIKPTVLFLGLTEEEIYSQNLIKAEPQDCFESSTKPDGNLNSTGPYDIKIDVQIKEDVDTESIQENNTNIPQDNKCLHAATKRKPLLNVRLESDDVALNSKDKVQNSTEIYSILYGDHQIKEEMVIGPTVLQKAINQYTDTPEKINKKISNNKNNSSPQRHRSLDLKKISSLALNSKNEILLSKAIDSILFEDHQIEEEMVIGSTVLQKRIIQNSETPEKFTETCKEVDDSNKENNLHSSNIDKHLEQPLCDKKNNKRRSNNNNNSSTQSHKSINLKKTSSQSEFICDYCLKSFDSKIQLLRHIQKEHNMLSSYRCKTCDKEFKDKKVFKTHLRSHEVQKDGPQCKICFKTFTLIVNLSRHIKQFHDKTIDFPCDQCHKTFKRKDYLVAHKRAIHLDKSKIHNSLNGSNFICDICQRSYPDKARLKRHLRYHRRKSNSEKYNSSTKFCDFCKKGFREKSGLIGHMKIHMEVTLPFPCEICDKKFAKKYSLSRHLISHSKKYMLSCKTCNQPFKTKWGCQRHERKCVQKHKPSNVSNFNCNICQRSYPDNARLKQHLRYHRRKSNSKKYNTSKKICDFCNKGFREKSCLIGHMKIHMEVALPFPCEICGKEFAFKYRLSRHLISHNKKYLFSCKTCNQPFKTRWGCQLHERKCLQKQLPKC